MKFELFITATKTGPNNVSVSVGAWVNEETYLVCHKAKNLDNTKLSRAYVTRSLIIEATKELLESVDGGL